MTQPEPGQERGDYDYIIRIIQYLENRHGINFFITCRDFDTLYRWWEKRIPLGIVKESISAVVARRSEKRKPISGFNPFAFDVRKNFKAFLELQVGSERTGETPGTGREIEGFLARLPGELAELGGLFEEAFASLKAGQEPAIDAINERLLARFDNDAELLMRVEVFCRHLAPQLRTPAVIEKYKLNYLWNRFQIPDFTGLY